MTRKGRVYSRRRDVRRSDSLDENRLAVDIFVKIEIGQQLSEFSDLVLLCHTSCRRLLGYAFEVRLLNDGGTFRDMTTACFGGWSSEKR